MTRRLTGAQLTRRLALLERLDGLGASADELREYLVRKKRIIVTVDTVQTDLRAMEKAGRVHHWRSGRYWIWELSRIGGGSCHPSHDPEALARQQQEELDRRRQEQRYDPRKIHRQHRWKLGHDPSGQDDDDDPNVVYLQMDGREAPPTEPDQLHMLGGGPESGIPCEQCGVGTRIAGEMSVWDIYHQPGVEVANLADMTDERRRELQEQIIVVLACPQCHKKYQWFADALPGRG